MRIYICNLLNLFQCFTHKWLFRLILLKNHRCVCANKFVHVFYARSCISYFQMTSFGGKFLWQVEACNKLYFILDNEILAFWIFLLYHDNIALWPLRLWFLCVLHVRCIHFMGFICLYYGVELLSSLLELNFKVLPQIKYSKKLLQHSLSNLWINSPHDINIRYFL